MPGWISQEEAFRTRRCPVCGHHAVVRGWPSDSDHETGYYDPAGRSLRCANGKCAYLYVEHGGEDAADPWPDPPEESATINRIMGIGEEE